MKRVKRDSEEKVGEWKNGEYEGLVKEGREMSDGRKGNGLYEEGEVMMKEEGGVIGM